MMKKIMNKTQILNIFIRLTKTSKVVGENQIERIQNIHREIIMRIISQRIKINNLKSK